MWWFSKSWYINNFVILDILQYHVSHHYYTSPTNIAYYTFELFLNKDAALFQWKMLFSIFFFKFILDCTEEPETDIPWPQLMFFDKI